MPEYFSDFTNYELPTFGAAVFSLLLSFVLSALIALTYRYTSRGEYSKNFFQALVLGSVVAATIMMAIGDSLAHGIGMIGALAIIRFRNRIRAPKNIIFIFSALAVGIAAGVYGYTIAVAGTMVFCFIALALHFSPYGKAINLQINFSFQMQDDSVLPKAEAIMQQLGFKVKLLGITFNNEIIKYEYRIILDEGISQDTFFNAVKDIEGIRNIRVNTSSNIDRI